MLRSLCRNLCGAAVLLLTICLWLATVAVALPPSPFDVLSYDTRVDIEENGDIVVTETITVNIPTNDTNKGIIRDIPINPRWLDLGRQNVQLTVEAISIDGKACRTDDTQFNYPVFSIYMRDQAHYLAAGHHCFVLRYRMNEQIGFFDEHDELTWNAVGEGWQGGVAKARATIFPPPGASFSRHDEWLGERGSFDSPLYARRKTIEGREALVVEALRPMEEGELFTVAVAWPKGVVAPPASLSPEDQWGYTLAYVACFLGALAAACALWSRYGRDPEGGPVIPLFYPPKVPQRLRAASVKSVQERKGRKQRLLHGEEFMTPVAVHYVHEGGKLESRGLAALFLSLAQRGDCSLRGSSQHHVVVEKHANTSPAPEESAAAGKLPDRLTLKARKNTNTPIGKIHTACKLRLNADYPMVVRWNLWPQLLLLVLLAAVLATTAVSQLGNNASPFVIEQLGQCAAGGLMILAGLLGAGLLIRDAIREHAFPGGLLAFLFICVVLICCGYPTLTEAKVLWIFSPLQWGLMGATLLVPVVFSFLMDMPSHEQVALRQQIKGLALYIGTAETERFNTLNPPEEDLQLYHRLLPYAVALGLEEAWGKRFADQLAHALKQDTSLHEGQYTITFTQDLLRGTHWSYSTYREAVAAERAAQAAQYASSSGGGSSFSGFGGGAGSGGGGGGGRAC